MANHSPLIVVAWNPFQARTSALAHALGGDAHHLYGRWLSRLPTLSPARYLADAIRMWWTLRKTRPEILVVISPPVVAPIVAWIWTLGHPCRLAVDCHTGAFNSPRWAWARPIHRFLFRRARAVLVHTREDEARVRAWGAPVILVPDDLPDPAEAAAPPARTAASRAVVAGSFDVDEPVATALAAAALIPEVEVRLTGEIARLPASVRSSAPPNAVFTGYLPYPQFLAELIAADLVLVLSTNPHIMNRAAFEALGLGRPLVLSDVPALRARFADAPLFCANDTTAMARTIREALRDREALAERSRALRNRLLEQRTTALARLRAMLDMADASPRLVAQPGPGPMNGRA